MKAGKIACVVLWLVLTGLTVGVVMLHARIPALQAMDPTARMIALSGLLASVFALILVPLGVALDISIRRLQRHIEDASGGEGARGAWAPRWAQPITRAVTGAVDRFQERERALRTQVRDLEIRHRVSEAHRQQIEAVLHSLRDGVVVTDAFNEIVMANETAARILGFDLENCIHQAAESVIGDGRIVQLLSDTRDGANFTNVRHVEHEIPVQDSLRADGEPRVNVFDLTLACVENHNHEVGGVVMILHDLTRDREVSQMKSDFVSKASHELRTPLSSIRAYVEMLVDGEATDEESRREFYRIIHNETDRLGRLIDNMLNISRIEAGIVQIERENVDFNPVIHRAIETIGPQAREKNISLTSKLADVSLCVEGDADMLFQVVLNLLSNAVKYTPEGGRVTVTADSDNLTRSVLVTVSDTGLGIPPDALPKLFEKFYRVENYKRVAKGTGLGLSLCKHIVETLHHGQIGVESKLGMGSRFWFSIPMRYAGKRTAA